MTASIDTIAPLRDFVIAMTNLVSKTDAEETLIAEGRKLLGTLVSRDDWLPEEFAQPHPEYYQQYLLHADPLERFSVVSFVWGPGQKTPVHDHTVWGLIGMLRGAEKEVRFEQDTQGKLHQVGGEVSRHVFKPDTDEVKPFVSGYSSTKVPNLWDRSATVRATLPTA